MADGASSASNTVLECTMHAAAISIPRGPEYDDEWDDAEADADAVEDRELDNGAAAVGVRTAVGDCNLLIEAATGVTLRMRNRCTVPSSDTAMIAPAAT